MHTHTWLKGLRFRLLALGATLILSIPLSVGVATFSATSAAAASCSVGAFSPYTDGNYVYGKASVSCSSGTASQLSARLGVNVGGKELSWGWSTPPSGSYSSRSTTTSKYCNGYGTDLWRNHARASVNGSYVSNSTGWYSLTC